MNAFKENNLFTDLDHVLRELKSRRLNSKKTLEQVSDTIGVRKTYLKAIEEGNFFLLPKGIYRRNYLRDYSNFLNISSVDVLKIYDESLKSDYVKNQAFSYSRLRPIRQFLFFKWFKVFVISLLLIFFFLYLGFSIERIISPPFLKIYYPLDSLTTDDNLLQLSGWTESGVNLIINGEEILLDTDGNFEKDINLKRGLNKIIIKAKKRYSRVREIEKQVLYKEEDVFF